MIFFGGQIFGPMPIFECLEYSKQTLLPSRFEPNFFLLGGSRNRCSLYWKQIQTKVWNEIISQHGQYGFRRMKLKEIINDLLLVRNLKAFKLQKLFTEPLNRKNFFSYNFHVVYHRHNIFKSNWLVLINLVSTGLNYLKVKS